MLKTIREFAKKTEDTVTVKTENDGDDKKACDRYTEAEINQFVELTLEADTQWLDPAVLNQLFVVPENLRRIFKKENERLVQLTPLSLKDECVNLIIVKFLDKIDELREKLGSKCRLNKIFFQRGLKMVHEALRLKLKDIKNNKL